MTDQAGYIALSRAYLHHPVVGIHDPEAFAVWCWLMAEAAWGERCVPVAGRSVALAPGQLSHSVRFIAAKFGWTKSRMDRFLKRLESEGLISKTGTDGGTGQSLITICDDTMFQAGSASDGTASGTEMGQQRDKERTINQYSSPPPDAGADEIFEAAEGAPEAGHNGSPEAGHDGGPEAGPVVQPAFSLAEPPGPDPVGRMVEAWNALARDESLPLVRTITAKRRTAAERWLRGCGGTGGSLSVWDAVLARIRASPVLTGRTGRMRADLDFALDPHQTTRIMEGCYDDFDANRTGRTGTGPQLVASDGAPVGHSQVGRSQAGRAYRSSRRADLDDTQARIDRLLDAANGVGADGA